MVVWWRFVDFVFEQSAPISLKFLPLLQTSNAISQKVSQFRFPSSSTTLEVKPVELRHNQASILFESNFELISRMESHFDTIHYDFRLVPQRIYSKIQFKLGSFNHHHSTINIILFLKDDNFVKRCRLSIDINQDLIQPLIIHRVVSLLQYVVNQRFLNMQ